MEDQQSTTQQIFLLHITDVIKLKKKKKKKKKKGRTRVNTTMTPVLSRELKLMSECLKD